MSRQCGWFGCLSEDMTGGFGLRISAFGIRSSSLGVATHTSISILAGVSLTDMVEFFAYELTGLGRTRFAVPAVLLDSSGSFCFRHNTSSSSYSWVCSEWRLDKT